MNWKELKEFCNQLPEKELTKNVMLWREDEAITRISASQMEEDQYVNVEGSPDGCFPLSEANGEDVERVYVKGHPVLHEDF